METPKRESDYGYKYPLKALYYDDIEVNVRKMRVDEMPDDGITYYCEIDGSIHVDGEKNFQLLNSCNHKWEVTITNTKQFNYCSVCKHCDVIHK